MSDERIARRARPATVILVEELDLHAGDVDARRTLALAALARHAQIQRFEHFGRRQGVAAELARQRKPQRVRAAASEVPLVERDAVRRAHRPHVEFSAVAVVVAHFYRGREAATAILRTDFVIGPIEACGERLRNVTRLEAEQLPIVHARRGDDLAWIHEAFRIERPLELGERVYQPGAVERLDPLGANEPIAVLAGIRPFVLLHHRAGFLGDRAHLAGAIGGAHVEHGAHVQTSDRCVRIKGSASSVLVEHAREAIGVFGEMLERHGAVLDERDGFAVALHRHHDVQPRLADFPHGLLQLEIVDRDDAAGQAEIAHELAQLRKFRGLLGKVFAREFHEQDRVGHAANHFVDGSSKRRNFARQLDHRSIDELDGGRSKPDDMPSEIHGLVERRKVHDAENLVPGQGRKLELDAPEIAERAFRADEHVGHVERAGRDHVEVVAGDTPLHVRYARGYLLALALEQRPHRRDEL